MSARSLFRKVCILLPAAAGAWPGAAMAALPDGVRAMIDAAIGTNDPAKVATILELARTTHAAESAEIDRIEAEWQRRLSEQNVAAPQVALSKVEEKAAPKAPAAPEVKPARWSGQAEFGAFQSSGNTNTLGLSSALKLKRTNARWSHLLQGRADYQRTNGKTSREQYFATYEPRYRFSNALFVYGLSQFERDKRQGFSARYAVSGGLGYKILEEDGMSFAVKAGPAYRVTKFNDGITEKSLAGLAGFDLDWKIFERLSLTQDANLVAESGSQATIIFDSSNTSINVITGLDAKITERLRTRVSYAYEYDSDPPVGAVSTDTTTRFSFVYGF